MQTEELAKTVAQSDFSETDLIEGCRAGKHEALEELVKRYQSAVLRVCVSLIGSRDVEDLVQDIFIKILRRIATFEGRSSLFTWIYEITVNHCRDELRKRKFRRWLSLHSLPQDALEQIKTDEASASEQMEAGELRLHLRGALNKLSPKYRELIVLRDLEGLSYGEIARISGIEEKLVKSRLYQGRKILAAKMKKYAEAYHD
ncbi:MAG: sigma-70 family RNA polymerase sigma factor [candidate division KSB1 bacterium]|nr:sigma-70 family RNA polymerase sigma factor [candidate division KSB1 bacterium]MDZ7304542.1 sigma-70 family RNA polymerase sigma factor [candidate division KSB1 bacterium]MDZ7313711.1 sigma-70 family RNA polymerase sigma factor [candidate division KSB1 bacterium]